MENSVINQVKNTRFLKKKRVFLTEFFKGKRTPKRNGRSENFGDAHYPLKSRLLRLKSIYVTFKYDLP